MTMPEATMYQHNFLVSWENYVRPPGEILAV